MILSRSYICLEFSIEYHQNLFQTGSNIFVVAKMWQQHFSLTYQATCSLRNDQQSNSIPFLGGPITLQF